jgi:MSHA biogenesis protein MshJ
VEKTLMIHFLKELQEKFDKRILRERCLIFLSATALLFMLWNIIVQDSIDKKIKDTQIKIDAAIVQRTATQTQVAVVAQAMLNDPNRIKSEQIEQLQTDIKDAQEKLHAASKGLIRAEQLPQVLQEVLQKTTQLSLLSVSTLPVREIPIEITSADLINPSSLNSGEMGIYEHAVELRVAGNYFQVLEWLKALEALPWRFYWQQLDYKVTQYPRSEIRLRVYTLSTEAGLLGV